MWFRFRPYVSVAKRRAEAKQKLLQLAKQGHIASPVQIAGRQIAVTFWGKGWCDHLESYSDFENRLPRGRTYVRNGSVVDLKIASCRITALVSGSELYRVRIGLKPLPRARWNSLKSACAGRIGSLVELLQGRLSSEVMAVVTDRENGLFPKPKEISMECSCPDWAGMCKHVAAVLYGVGARLDEQPDLLFRLRQVDYRQLIGDLSNVAKFRRSARGSTRKAIENQNLAEIFDIELDTANDDEMDATETARAATERSTQSQKKPGVKSHNISRHRKPSSGKKSRPIEPLLEVGGAIAQTSAIASHNLPTPSKRRQRVKSDLQKTKERFDTPASPTQTKLRLKRAAKVSGQALKTRTRGMIRTE